MQSSVVPLCVCICILSANAAKLQALGNSDTLELVHVIFRHGDRTPEAPYPNDPYANETYFPVGYGELTNTGKLTAYKIGTALRENYGSFLGDIYTPALIEAISSPYSRCRASVQFVLAGLFPPTEIQQWNKDLEWLGIPYVYTPQDLDKLFWAVSNCQNFGSYYAENLQSYYTSPAFAENLDVLSYLAQNSGYQATDPQIALQLFSTLKSQQEWGLTLPPWTDTVWPEPITSLAAQAWTLMTGSRKTTTLLGGFLLSKIVTDTYSKINGDESLRDRKIYLYSGHDLTVAAVLGWLGVFEPHNPPYGAYVSIEVHNYNGLRGIKIFYHNYLTPEPVLLTIPNSDGTLDQFVQLYEPYFRAEDVC